MGSPFQILNAMKVFLCFSPTHTPFKGRIFTYKVAFRPHIAPNGAPSYEGTHTHLCYYGLIMVFIGYF